MSHESSLPFEVGDTEVLNNVMRLSIPLRREFSMSLDLQRFMRDATYAKEVIEQALASSDAKLRERASYLKARIFGLKGETPPKSEIGITETFFAPPPAIKPAALAMPVPAPVAATLPAESTAKSTEPAEEESEAAMRARMMSKYKTGLR